MLTVHHLGKSQSERIVWLCEELEIPYELKRYTRDAVTMLAPPEYKALHPIGSAPVIIDGDLVLAESGAIVDYIVHRYAQGRLALKPDDPAYARYLYWLHFAEGSLMSLMLIELVLSRVPEAAASPVTGRVRDRMKQMLSYVDAEIADGPWFAGAEFTAADVMMTFPFTTMRLFLDYELAPYANIAAYVKRVEARPTYRRAMSLAGRAIEK